MIICKTTYVGGLYFEILNDEGRNKEYLVEFIDNDKGELIYSINKKKGVWSRVDKKYLMDIDIVISRNGKVERCINTMDIFRNRKVFISFDSASLGDTLAWIPYCEEFRVKHQCEMIVSTFMNELFEDEYPDIKFVGRGAVVDDIYGMFELGWFYDKLKEPEHPATIPLQKAACNILRLKYEEIRPRISFKPQERPIPDKYVCISTKSTAQLKEWYYWQELIDWLVSNGYKVVEISKDDTDFNNLTPVEDKSIPSVMNYLHYAEFFIGLSSGISWLSFAMKKKVFMIANFSNEDHEFKMDCVRIVNKEVCNSCWNNPMYRFNRGDFFYCPEHEDTPRAFECHKSISAEMVIEEIKKAGY